MAFESQQSYTTFIFQVLNTSSKVNPKIRNDRTTRHWFKDFCHFDFSRPSYRWNRAGRVNARGVHEMAPVTAITCGRLL